jgi:hypothetical protein
LETIALLNAATAAMRNQRYEQSRFLVEEALSRTANVEDSRVKGYALINAGLICKALIFRLPELEVPLSGKAFEAFQLAVRVARKIGVLRPIRLQHKRNRPKDTL